MPRLLIIIGQHLATAPRPQKEAAAAKAAGFEVFVRGTWWSESLAVEDLEIAEQIGVNFQAVLDIRPGSRGRRMHRIRQKLARELFVRFRRFSPRLLGIGTLQLLKAAKEMRADLTMVHSEGGLWIAEQLLKAKMRVGVDFEDWFSQDMPEQDRRERPVQEIQRLERLLLNAANPVLTTSRAMATALAKDAGVQRLPVVIPNAFPWRSGPHSVPVAERELLRDKRSESAVSFHWFSQTIGPSRGLECLALALPLLQGDWELHLRGRSDFSGDWIQQTFGKFLDIRVFIHPPTSNATLAAFTASHDVGLALEIPYAANKDLTSSNKIFEYMRCGLAVIATDTAGQKEILAACPEAGVVVKANDVDALAKAMQRFMDDRTALRGSKLAVMHAAEQVWAWERFEPLLQEAMLKAVS